jgi:EmrB/QacA subfamily drug resistance transporter
MLILDLSIVAVALPSIQQSLGASLSELQWVFDSYALTLAACLVTAGSIADRSGRKLVFTVGLAIFTVASLLCGVASNARMLDVSRGVQGIGAAVLYAVGPALLGHDFHGKERARAFAAFGAATGIAAATGPLIGGSLTSGPGWRWIFLINVPVGVLMIVVAVLRLRESRAVRARPADLLGMVLFTLSLSAMVLAVIRGNRDGWLSGTNVALYLGATAGLPAFFVVARRRRERAMFDLAMFRSRTFLGLCVATLLVNCCGFPFIFIATTYMQSVLGSSAWQAGVRFLPMTAAMFVIGGVAGELTKRVPFRVMIFIACMAVGFGALLTELSDAGSSWRALIPALIVTGLGIGAFMPARAALSIGVFEPVRAGVASGISETFQQVGVALGLAVAGSFFENRVIDAFEQRPSGTQLGANAADAGSAISAGGIDAVSRSVDAVLRSQVLEDGRAAFAVGFHQTMTLCAVFAFLGALVALLLVSNKDLHESAITGVPPEVPEPVREQH